MPRILAAVLVVLGAGLAGCLADDAPASQLPAGDLPELPSLALTGPCFTEEGGPAPPPGEDIIGLQPVDLIFGGSIRHADTRVVLVPPTHGDLGDPFNMSRSGLAYLEATLAGIYAWEPAIDLFIEKYPPYGYLDNITVNVHIMDEPDAPPVGTDIVIGYAETSGPLFRGIAIDPGINTQLLLESAGIGGIVHYSNRYILLSLFAYSERAGQTAPDFPETHEVRGVTMHEFAHTWGLGHSTTWSPGCGGDLMNSPYPYIYGDGEAVGDGGERTKPLCISSLDLFGLAHLYRWLPNGTWEGSEGSLPLPDSIVYEEYCQVFEQAQARAAAHVAAYTRG